jgi:cyclopropane fatty-acyl-phospholipid synthase-like methyltransferase
MSDLSLENWFQQYEESLWLQQDETGENDAAFLISALSLKPGERVLDAPCGAGRVSIHFAHAGCKVTGIDFTENFIKRARQRFSDENLSGDFHDMDLRKMNFTGQFDAVCNWGGSFGYYNDDENLILLRKMASALKPGGRLLIDQVHRERLLRHFVSECKDGDLVRRNCWNNAAQRVDSALYSGDEEKPGTFCSVRLYTPKELKHLFAKAGLSWKAEYGGIDGKPFAKTSRRLIAVGKKLTNCL